VSGECMVWRCWRRGSGWRQNLGHQLSKTFWVTAIGMWMPRPYNVLQQFFH
jgi:hypothetical protein